MNITKIFQDVINELLKITESSREMLQAGNFDDLSRMKQVAGHVAGVFESIRIIKNYHDKLINHQQNLQAIDELNKVPVEVIEKNKKQNEI